MSVPPDAGSPAGKMPAHRLERDEFRLGHTRPDEVVGAFAWGDGLEDLADGVAYGVLGSGGGLAQPVLELGEELLDRVQVGGVFRQEEEPGAGGADGAPDGAPLCEPRLSMTTMSPGRSVGTSTRST